MVMVSPLVLDVISKAFLEKIEVGIILDNLYAGFNTSYFHGKDDPSYSVHGGIIRIELPSSLKNKFLLASHPHSRLLANCYLNANFSNCAKNTETKEMVILADSINTLTVGNFLGRRFSLIEVFCEGDPKDENDYNNVSLSRTDELYIANNILNDINALNPQLLLNAFFNKSNDERSSNFCSTFDR